MPYLLSTDDVFSFLSAVSNVVLDYLGVFFDFVAAISWPFVAFVGLLLFRRQIQGIAHSILIARRVKASVAGVSLEWDQRAEEAVLEIAGAAEPASTALSRVVDELPPGGVLDSNTDRIRAAYGLVRNALEVAVGGRLNSDKLPPVSPALDNSSLVSVLVAQGMVDEKLVSAIRVLDDLFATFASAGRTPTDQNVDSFVRLSKAILSRVPSGQ